MKNKEIAREIYELHTQMVRALKRSPGKGGFLDILKNASDSLTDEKKEMLKEINNFRTQMAHCSEEPKLPKNYQEWIDFMKEEIAILEGEK